MVTIVTTCVHFPAEFLMKCQVLHNSTGVAVLKDKTVVNTKNPFTPSAPLGLLQFQTHYSNLSLEVSGALSGENTFGSEQRNLNASKSYEGPLCARTLNVKIETPRLCLYVPSIIITPQPPSLRAFETLNLQYEHSKTPSL